MPSTLRVELHCHSVFSDGTATPAELAEWLAAHGIAVAALTDHDTVDALSAFQQSLARHRIGCITGVELTTRQDASEIHLLAYGFDPTNSELLTVLQAQRQTRPAEVDSITGVLRRKGMGFPEDAPPANGQAYGLLATSEAIALVHRAGGKVFLAHPLHTCGSVDAVRELLAELTPQGLDGLEAIYGVYSSDQRDALCAMADALNLLVCAGTDAHEHKGPNPQHPGIDMPVHYWQAFRDAVGAINQPIADPAPVRHPHTPLDWRAFGFHVVAPTLIAIALFIVAIYAVFLPGFERSLMDRKREMIRELTNSAWSILNGYERDEREGRLTRDQAQQMAITRIELLRYGRDGKDYFWLQDHHPRMIMHPYRKDLNGRDVSGFRDPRGRRIFSEFAAVVQRGREGYVNYVWQWKDDPGRLAPKESYIKGFEPWGWIIGTGLYVEDVHQEIAQIESRLRKTALGITLVLVLLLAYVMRQSLGLERERADAEQHLYESNQRYRSLVEATTEGALLVMDGRCSYANTPFLEMAGRTREAIGLTHLTELFPETRENANAWQRLHRLLQGEELADRFDAVLAHVNGTLIECVVVSNPITIAERSGFILMVRNVTPPMRDGVRERRWSHLQQMVEGAPVGLFRARASAHGVLAEYNDEVTRLFPAPHTPNEAISLVHLFRDASDYEAFLHQLLQHGEGTCRLSIHTGHPDAHIVLLSARLERDDTGQPRYINGMLQDVSEAVQRERELEASVQRMQTSLLFLHEPIRRVMRSAVYCPLDMPIRQVCGLMTEQHSSAALVQSSQGDVVGIVTDNDIRRRVVSAGLDLRIPIHRVMSAPLIAISDQAVIYEALLLMEQEGVKHLAVTDDMGEAIGVLRNHDLLQFRSYGPLVLSRQVQQAATTDEVEGHCRQVPDLAKALLSSGAHPRQVTRMVSSVCDAASVRLLELAEAELGPAPVPYVFLALGSHGRQEMTLASDQDNAIVYAEPPAELLGQTEAYMRRLSEWVCGGLHKAGYRQCSGDVMARNHRWRQPLSVWRRYFTEWISMPEPQQLLQFSVFFDFRPVYGDESLASSLREHIAAVLRQHPAFYPQFAHDALQFRPPARFLGRLLPGDHAGQLNLKELQTPIVAFARLYALRHGIDDTHTVARLEALQKQQVLQASSVHELVAAYDLLTRLRLNGQASQQAAGQPVDNTVRYRMLGPSDQALLHESFTQIAAVQKRIGYDFHGGAL